MLVMDLMSMYWGIMKIVVLIRKLRKNPKMINNADLIIQMVTASSEKFQIVGTEYSMKIIIPLDCKYKIR